MKIKSGGGLTSNKLVQDRKYKSEPVTRKVNVDAAAQQGLSVQFERKPLQQGPGSGYQPKSMGSTGIANARQGHAGPGPGGGNRMIYGSGSQSPCPPAREMGKGRDTLSEFGPDVPGRRG